ncbi:MAG: LysR family transcriptional regulator, partial [Clostridia bacterium]|nr:LysR family transcriptional regulator [Clostridia bacterium]
MDIKNLTTFIYVAEMNSFTKAAAALGYTQSTVSFQIKQLEGELNCQLFERINHSISLTRKGHELLDYAHNVKRMTDELKGGMNTTAEPSGHIVLATASSLCKNMLGNNYAHFYKHNKGITLKVIEAGTEEMLRMVDHNEVDMILTLDSHIYNSGYIIAKEERVGVHFIAAPDYNIETRVKMADIARHPMVLTEKGMSYIRIFEEKLSEKSLAVKPVLETGNTDIICDIIKQGVGIGLLPDYVADKRVKNGELRYIEVEDLEIEVWKQLLYHKNKWVSREMEAVLNY